MENNKLREAFRQAKEIARMIYSTSDKGSSHEDLAEKIVELANAALAEPTRNCDIGTPDEQLKRFNNFCVSHYKDLDEHGVIPSGCDCPCQGKDGCNAFVWSQMPYGADEEGGAK